jgi:aspartate 1-decarboxylase
VAGTITAVNAAAGTITIQDEDGPTTVVLVGAAAGTYHVGEDVDVVGTPTGPGRSAATVQAQFVTREGPEALASVPAAAPVPPVVTTGRPAGIEVKGLITAVNAAAGTITVQNEDGPIIVVSLGAAAGTYQVGQKVKVLGVPTRARGSTATVRAQYVTLEDAAAPTVATPVGTHVEVKGLITAVNHAAGTLTIQDEDGPTTVVSVGAAGTYQVGQEVEVSGIVTSARSNGATVQAQFIRLKSPNGGDN